MGRTHSYSSIRNLPKREYLTESTPVRLLADGINTRSSIRGSEQTIAESDKHEEEQK